MSALPVPTSQPRTQQRVRTVILDGQVRRVKFCTGCLSDRIAEEGNSEFPISTRYKGKVVFHAHCKDCRRRERQERRERDPAWAAKVREENKAYARRARQNPENQQKIRERRRRYYVKLRERDAEGVNELARFYYALRKEREGKKMRARKTVIDGTSPRVLAEPFREWLVAYKEAVCMSPEELALDLCVTERRIRATLAAEQKQVALDIVDSALTHARCTVTLKSKMITRTDDLYPLDEREKRE